MREADPLLRTHGGDTALQRRHRRTAAAEGSRAQLRQNGWWQPRPSRVGASPSWGGSLQTSPGQPLGSVQIEHISQLIIDTRVNKYMSATPPGLRTALRRDRGRDKPVLKEASGSAGYATAYPSARALSPTRASRVMIVTTCGYIGELAPPAGRADPSTSPSAGRRGRSTTAASETWRPARAPSGDRARRRSRRASSARSTC